MNDYEAIVKDAVEISKISMAGYESKHVENGLLILLIAELRAISEKLDSLVDSDNEKEFCKTVETLLDELKNSKSAISDFEFKLRGEKNERSRRTY